jgi:actin-like ATPase involved in cell morphogenesis
LTSCNLKGNDVDIGGGTTEIAVIAHGIVCDKSVKCW